MPTVVSTPAPLGSALPTLLDGVRAYFALEGVTANVVFGRRQLAQQMNQGPGGANRVVFMLGDEGGRFGKILGPRLNGGANPRPLVRWEMVLEVAMWAADPEDPRDELASVVALHKLFQATIAAVRSVAHADATWSDTQRTIGSVESPFGIQIVVPLLLRGPLCAPPITTSFPTLKVITKAI